MTHGPAKPHCFPNLSRIFFFKKNREQIVSGFSFCNSFVQEWLLHLKFFRFSMGKTLVVVCIKKSEPSPYPPFPSFSFFHAPNDGIIADMLALGPKKRRKEKNSRDGRRVQPAICFNNHHQQRRAKEKCENVQTRTSSQMEKLLMFLVAGNRLIPQNEAIYYDG